MVVDDRRLGVECGRDRDTELLGECDHFRLCARADDAAASDDHRALGFAERLQGLSHVLQVRLGAERRRAGEALLHQRVEIRLGLGDLAEVALHAQVHRAGRAGRGDAERLADQVAHAADVIDLRVELRHRVELRDVVHLLVGVTVARLRRGAAGDGDYRRTRHKGVAHAGSEV
jgi:hypothetical protein